MSNAWIEIDRGAYQRNLTALARWAACPVLAVVKANAYGHGAPILAAAALEMGCPGVAVARVDEGVALRAAGIAGRIVILGLSLPDEADTICDQRLEPVVADPAMVAALARAGERAGSPVPVHVKVDTGMTRAGLDPAAALALCREIRAGAGLLLAGALTHFAAAEAEDGTTMRAQWRRFEGVRAELAQWTPRPLLHAANSAAALWFPPACLDWVRGGLLTYGVAPADRPLPFSVEPVAAVKARLVQVREVPAGRAVSYGGTWTTARPSRLALAPLGYGDGLPWNLSSRGWGLVKGRRAPIRGRVCMDQVVLDVTDLPPVHPGEEAVFLGRQGDAAITAMELAHLAETIPYEILTRLAERLPRRVV